MRNVDFEIGRAFRNGEKMNGTRATKTDGNQVTYHGNIIAYKRDGRVWLSFCGYNTLTTRNRINGVLAAYGKPPIRCKDGVNYIGDRTIPVSGYFTA